MGGKTAAQWIAIFQDKNRSWVERRQAVEAIGYLGLAARSAVPCLIQAIDPTKTGDAKLDRTNDSLRHDAIEALGRIGPVAAEAIPKLFPKTGDGRLLASPDLGVVRFGYVQGVRVGLVGRLYGP